MTTPPSAEAQKAAAAVLPDLLEAVRADPTDVEAAKAFWRAYLALPMWLFVARGTPDAPTPFVVVLENRPTLLVFSTAQGAKESALALGLPEEEASLILAVPTASAVDWAAQHQQSGVVNLQLDRHLDGFVVPLASLGAIRAGVLGDPPPGPGEAG